MTAGEPPPEDKRRWKKPKDAGAETRALTVNAKGVKKRSSREWIARQINDPYVQRAQAEGWRARSAFKLMELDDRFALIGKGMRVCDLGAAPGGWAQVALKRGAGAVVGIDLLAVDALPGATFLTMDFLDDAAPAALMTALGGAPDLVLSDMAANTTGHRATDQIKTGALAEAAADFALDVLAPGGAFLTKAFQGGLDGALLAMLKTRFTEVRHAKPPASRSASPEIYVVAKGFKGAA
ncbi:MAG: RlmE family RNA methyltransferase [Hyphomonadaceae bacterium]|nr:RlmE family RNA methyltransferase [Hyphomonadaceae bacterium]